MELTHIGGLPTRWTSELRASGITTVNGLLTFGEIPLCSVLRTSFQNAREVTSYVAHQVQPRPSTAKELLDLEHANKSTLASGLPMLDKALQGGLQPSLTELCGPAGSGKTQMCLSLAATATSRPFLEGQDEADGVIYIDTERAFSAERLRELLISRYPHVYGIKAIEPQQVRQEQ